MNIQDKLLFYLLSGIFSNIFFCFYFLHFKQRKEKKLDAIIALICVFIFPLLWIKFIKEEILKL